MRKKNQSSMDEKCKWNDGKTREGKELKDFRYPLQLAMHRAQKVWVSYSIDSGRKKAQLRLIALRYPATENQRSMKFIFKHSLRRHNGGQMVENWGCEGSHIDW